MRSQEVCEKITLWLCDGDSKAFDAICEDGVYCEDIKLEKEDCINHVSKRMGTGLRKLVDAARAEGGKISGKGKLTREKITKIENYYGKAVNQAATRIMKLCQQMSGRSLSHCLNDWQVRGMTQNSNESFHNVIWKICPKTIYVGRHTIETAVAMPGCQFAMGATFKTLLYKCLGVEPGAYIQSATRAKSAKRLKLAEKACSEDAKRKRKQLKYHNVTKEMKQKQKEGTTYAAGDFSWFSYRSTIV